MLATVVALAAAIVRPRVLVPPSARLPVVIACAASSTSSSSSSLDAFLDAALNAEQRKRSSLLKEAEAAKKAERLSAWATLVVANLYRIDSNAESVVVEDWENGGQATELRFDAKGGTPREQADKAFAKARKMRRGSAVVAELIQQSETREGRLATWRERSVGAAQDDVLQQGLLSEIMRDAKKLKLPLKGLLEDGGAAAAPNQRGPRGSRSNQQPLPIAPSKTPGWSGREFLSPAGVPILVGRNRKENEQLSLSIAKDPDVWMHVRGSPGAHVILRLSQMKGRPPPEDDCLQMAADLAAFYSEMRDENKVLVSYAEPRHVTKPNGAPLGAVKLREEGGTIVGRPTSSDLLPPELYEHRERERFGGGGGAPVMSGGGAKKWT